MPFTKGNPGGPGRPPGLPNPRGGRPATSKRVKVGDTFYVSHETPDGSLAGELWTVESVTRGKIIFACNGEKITLTN